MDFLSYATQVWNAGTGKHSMRKEITGFNHWVRALFATDKELYCGSYQTIEVSYKIYSSIYKQYILNI